MFCIAFVRALIIGMAKLNIDLFNPSEYIPMHFYKGCRYIANLNTQTMHQMLVNKIIVDHLAQVAVTHVHIDNVSTCTY